MLRGSSLQIQDLLALATLVAVVSGCVGGEASSASATPTASSTVQPSGSSIDPGVQLGAIGGTVVDEELEPIRNAEVALLKPIQLSARTDEAGRFAFEKLEPGTYDLFASALGFESASRRVDVVAGETINVSLTVKAAVIGDEPYYIAVPKTAFFGADSDFIAYLQYGWGVNVSAINDVRCSPCMFVLHIDPNPKYVRTEVVWQSSSTPYFNNYMCGNYQKNWSDDVAGQQGNMVGFCMNNRAHLDWATAKPSPMKETTRVRLLVDGGFIAVQWRMDVWTTFAYLEDLPDEYTALPPP